MASQSSSIFSSASAAAMVDSGTMQAPARSPPMKVSRYSIELAARMATLSPRPIPMPASLRAILFTRRSKFRQLRAAPSHFTAGLAGNNAALRATRTGIERNSGNSAVVGCGTSGWSALIADRAAYFLGSTT